MIAQGYVLLQSTFLWSLKFSLYVGNRYFIWSLVWGDPAPQTLTRPIRAKRVRSRKSRGGDGIPDPLGLNEIRYVYDLVNLRVTWPLAGKSGISKQGA